MFLLMPPKIEIAQSAPLRPDFYSVEFPLNVIQPVYQFKLWRSDNNSFFLLAKESSDLVSQLKVGNVMHEFPESSIAESFRALRTNLDFYKKNRR